MIGVNADQETNRATGVPGVPMQVGLLERWMQWLNDIRPRLDTRHSPLITVEPGKVACVLYQPASSLAPHMADYRYWLRAGPKNQEMPEEMVQRYYLARQVGDRAARDVLESLAWGAKPNHTTLLSVLVCPMRLDNETVPITPNMTQVFKERVQKVVQGGPHDTITLFEAAELLRPSYHGLRGNASTARDPDAFMEVWRNGFVRITATLRVRNPGSGGFNAVPLIPREAVFAMVPEFLRAGAALMEAMPYHGFVTVVCTVTQTQGKIVAPGGLEEMFSSRSLDMAPCEEDVLMFSREVVADELQSRYSELCQWFVVRILQAFNHRVYEVHDKLLDTKIERLSALTF